MAVWREWPVIGHEWAVEHLTRAIEHDRMRHAYLITGPARIGKTTLALAFAAALNCTGDPQPCGVCRACTLLRRGAHPDLTIVQPEQEGGALKIEQMRDLQQTLSLRPYEARYRIAILRRFDQANPAAANALLKTLEEPPPNVVLILTADSADPLLPTIVSRCQPLHLRPLARETVRDALLAQFGADAERAETLARLSEGRMGWAIRALQDPAELALRDKALDMLQTALVGNRQARFDLAEQLATDKVGLPTLLEIWQGYWRDVLLTASGSTTPITNVDHEPAIRAVAQVAGRDAAHAAIQATRRTLDYLGKNVNPRLALEVLMLDYPALARGSG